MYSVVLPCKRGQVAKFNDTTCFFGCGVQVNLTINSVVQGVPGDYIVPTTDNSGSSNVGAIVGGVIGGVVVLALLVVLVWVFRGKTSGGANIEMMTYKQHDAGLGSTRMNRLGSMGERTARHTSKRASYLEIGDDEEMGAEQKYTARGPKDSVSL